MKKITFAIPSFFDASEIREMLSFAFQTLLVAYLSFFLLENLKPGFVSGYMDLSIWFWAAIISGLLSALWPHVVVMKTAASRQRRWVDTVTLALLALGTGGYLWYKLATLGVAGKSIAIVSALLVIGLNSIGWDDREETDR